MKGRARADRQRHRAEVGVAIGEALRVTWLDRVLIAIAPEWGLRRVRARATAKLLARHYEAAQGGRRTSGWQRFTTDANSANGPALTALRELSRDLLRNNGWAQNGVSTIVNNTVGWGITAKPLAVAARAAAIWKGWADKKSCDFDGQLNFYGLQALAMRTLVESGEVLILKQPAATVDGLSVPLRIQVLEPDYIDTTRSAALGLDGTTTIDGVEFDKQGRRVAYWLYTSHPGGMRLGTKGFASVRTPADRVLHIYRVDRPGQVRGVAWLASAIAKLNDLDDFEDAELMKQKVAACFAGFVSDMDGTGPPTGLDGTDEDGSALDQLEPGHLAYLPPGKQITFAQPPNVIDGAFSTRVLRRIAASLGVTYEDLTSDYSNVNFSSARMAQISHWARVRVWRWQTLIPGFCDGVWAWVMGLAAELEGWPEVPGAEWSAPPMPILEPDKIGLAYQRMIRNGLMTWPQAVRELGEDPAAQLVEIEATNKELDRRGIVLDSDPRRMTASGQQQSGGTGPAAAKPDAKPDAGDNPDPAPPADEAAPEDDTAEPTPAADKGDTVASKKAAAPAAEVKVFAYHQPFMRANEIREGIGLAADAPDGELFAGEFLAKHGAPAAPAKSGGDSSGA